MFKKILKVFLIIFILVIVCMTYVLYNAVSIYKYSKIDKTQSADVAIVLGAGTYNGKPLAVYRGRISHAIKLYKNGIVKKLIFTGGYGGGNSISDAEAAKKYARQKGVPEKDILIEELSCSTQGNLLYSHKIMSDNGYKHAVVVSDPLHMKRTMLVAKDIGIAAHSSPATTTVYETFETNINFLMRETLCYSGYSIYRFFVRGSMREKLSTEKIVYLMNMLLSQIKVFFEKMNATWESITQDYAKTYICWDICLSISTKKHSDNFEI